MWPRFNLDKNQFKICQTKISVVNQNFCQKYKSLSKIEILVKNRNFREKSKFSWKILAQNITFYQNFQFWSKIVKSIILNYSQLSFGQNFWLKNGTKEKIKVSAKNRNYGQKLKIFSKIKMKSQNFCLNFGLKSWR